MRRIRRGQYTLEMHRIDDNLQDEINPVTSAFARALESSIREDPRLIGYGRTSAGSIQEFPTSLLLGK